SPGGPRPGRPSLPVSTEPPTFPVPAPPLPPAPPAPVIGSPIPTLTFPHQSQSTPKTSLAISLPNGIPRMCELPPKPPPPPTLCAKIPNEPLFWIAFPLTSTTGLPPVVIILPI